MFPGDLGFISQEFRGFPKISGFFSKIWAFFSPNPGILPQILSQRDFFSSGGTGTAQGHWGQHRDSMVTLGTAQGQHRDNEDSQGQHGDIGDSTGTAQGHRGQVTLGTQRDLFSSGTRKDSMVTLKT